MMDLGPPRKSTVLLVTEDAGIRVVIEVGLRPVRCKLVVATDADEGLELYRRSPPDLVLLDLSGMNVRPLEFCRRLRPPETRGEVPIVVLGGEGDTSAIQQARSLGVADMIQMPLSVGLLAHRVEFLLAAGAERRRLSSALDRMGEAQRFARIGIWELCPTQHTLEVSDEARRILGLPARDLGLTVDSLLRNVPLTDRARVRTWLDDAIHGGVESTIEHRISMPEGIERVVRQHAASSPADARSPRRISVVISDISEWREAEARNRYQATHDPVTGLDNLDRFLQRLEEATWVAQRHGGRFAVLYLGVADFGRVHESLGHRPGDGVLKAIAERLQGGFRKTDWTCSITPEGRYPRLARLDGAEFAVLLQPVEQIEVIARLASRLNQLLSEPISWGGQELFLRTHFGVAIYPGDGERAEDLLQRAQAAMRRAQGDGRSEAYFVTARMTEEAAERLALETSLRHAIERDELDLHYQPKVDVDTGRVIGMEALLRWHHPELGAVSPAQFVPLAEDTGVIVPIGEWVLRTACRQVRAWIDAGLPPLSMAVNVSVQQLRRSGIAETVERILAETGVPASCLEIELTETGLMNDSERSILVLHALKKLGVTLAVDDFGTGYSSLSYLRRLPIDTLKIDRSFVTDLARDPDADAIVTTIVQMARTLDLVVVAEGVETEEQLELLRGLGCDQYQGFLFSRPRTAAAATELLEQQRGRTDAA